MCASIRTDLALPLSYFRLFALGEPEQLEECSEECRDEDTSSSC